MCFCRKCIKDFVLVFFLLRGFICVGRYINRCEDRKDFFNRGFLLRKIRIYYLHVLQCRLGFSLFVWYCVLRTLLAFSSVYLPGLAIDHFRGVSLHFRIRVGIDRMRPEYTRSGFGSDLQEIRIRIRSDRITTLDFHSFNIYW